MIEIRELVHRYPVWVSEEVKTEKTALDGISFDVPSGQFLAILGPNGCGKSTLAKHLNVLLLPDEGTVWIDGKNTADGEKLWAIREQVGMVFQDPDDQIIGTSVEEDVAFGPENRCVAPEEIRRRVTDSLRVVGLLPKRRMSPARLSGGEKQRLATAGTIVGDPGCLVLDEPTAMLDPAARREVLALVRRLNRERGITVVLITHHTDEVVDADVLMLMDRGKVVFRGTPAEAFARPELLRQVRMDVPQVTELACRLAARGVDIRTPVLRQEELVERLLPLLDRDRTAPAPAEEEPAPAGEAPILSVERVGYTYGRGTANECRVLEDVSFDLYPGECLGLIGASGSGKTTLIKHLNGLLRPERGAVRFRGRSTGERRFDLTDLRRQVGLVFQYPEHQLFCQTVLKDVCYGPMNLGRTREEAEAAARRSLELVGIGADKLYVHPLELSGGEKRRVAMAGVLAMEPKVLVLDEPAAGLDPETKHMIFHLLTRVKAELGVALVLVSHHMEDVAAYADRVLVLDGGRLAMTGTPAQVFRQSRRLRELGIGIPQITAATEALMDAGVKLPQPAVTVEQAEEMLLPLLGEEVGRR